MRPALAPAAALALLALAACGGDPTSAPEPGARQPGPLSWVPVPGMICADGSTSGVAVSTGTADGVLVVLSGGGACWSDTRCGNGLPWYLGGVPRSFGQGDFNLVLQVGGLSGTLLDRTLPGNPFALWTQVFVPYCTGDVHAGGDVTREYLQNATSVAWRHRGAANLQAAVAQVKARVARPSRVVVAGSSAGGFGALLALDLVHAAWDAGGATSLSASLVDDSGPTFVGAAMPPALLAQWWAQWALSTTLGADCAACETDLSAAWDRLHARHAGDRLALLSTTEDATMRGYLVDPAPMSTTAFSAALDGLCEKLGGTGSAFGGKAACYRVGGATLKADHALLTSPARYRTGLLADGEPLLGWLGKVVSGAAWGSAGP